LPLAPSQLKAVAKILPYLAIFSIGQFAVINIKQKKTGTHSSACYYS
jgi:hypothetical protein